jgi:hypothetical protein
MTQQRQRPLVAQAHYTFNLTGTCVICTKKVTRSRTFAAESTEQANEKAATAVDNGLWHRKCGGN